MRIHKWKGIAAIGGGCLVILWALMFWGMQTRAMELGGFDVSVGIGEGTDLPDGWMDDESGNEESGNGNVSGESTGTEGSTGSAGNAESTGNAGSQESVGNTGDAGSTENTETKGNSENTGNTENAATAGRNPKEESDKNKEKNENAGSREAAGDLKEKNEFREDAYYEEQKTEVSSSAASALSATPTPSVTPVPSMVPMSSITPTPSATPAPAVSIIQVTAVPEEKQWVQPEIFYWEDSWEGEQSTSWKIEAENSFHILSLQLNEKECAWSWNGDLLTIQEAFENNSDLKKRTSFKQSKDFKQSNTVRILALCESAKEIQITPVVSKSMD